MATRIRYEDNDSNPYELRNGYDKVSTSNFHSSTTDAMYIVYLNTEGVSYRVKNMTSGRTYDGGDGLNNLHVLKRHVRERLSKLGVQLDSEIRDNSNREVGVNCSYGKGEKKE